MLVVVACVCPVPGRVCSHGEAWQGFPLVAKDLECSQKGQRWMEERNAEMPAELTDSDKMGCSACEPSLWYLDPRLKATAVKA